MSLRLQPARVDSNSQDIGSLLVFAEDLLVAVLVEFSDKHRDEAGMWFLEADFGRLTHASSPTFANLEEAQTWIAQRLTSRR